MARPSAIYRSSQQAQSQLLKTKYKFPILDPRELVKLYDTMGFDINEAMLMRPTSSFMKSLIEQIIDKFLYISPYSLREKVSKMNIGNGGSGDENDDAHGDHEDNSGSDRHEYYDIRPSISIVACQRIMYRFLCDCGIDDFSIRDVSKPEAARLRMILSALINYARFREERMGDLDELMDNNDKLLENYKGLIRKNQELEAQINKISSSLSNQSYTLAQLHSSNEELENQLRELRHVQKQLMEDHEKYKGEKTGLINELENQSALYIETEKDLEEIRPYIKESPESIKELIQKMKESEWKELDAVGKSEQKLSEINITLDSFRLLIQNTNSLLNSLDDMRTEAGRNKIHDERQKVLANQIVETETQANEYNRKISQVERQIKHNEERISKLQTFYSEKMKSMDAKLADQLVEFNKIKSDRNIEDLQLSEKESEINEWNNKLGEVQRQFDYECKEANFEFEKLNSKVTLYISQLKNKINESINSVSL
jgi:kinetochore protein Nuf2